MKAPCALLLAGAASMAAVEGALVTIDNTKPRLDVNGEIMDAHDHTLFKHSDGRYYMHAIEYGLCQEPQGMGCNTSYAPPHCGFYPNHNISVWSSPNISSGSWTFEGYALEASKRPAGTIFRPDVVFNPNTKEFNLWYNFLWTNGSYAGYAAATSPNITGPFELQVLQVPGLVANNDTWHAGDFHRFIDDDGTAYVIYSSNHYMFVDELASDQLSGTGRGVGPIGPYFVEAPSLFKRNGVYYALFGHCCCYCYQGSGIMVFTAPHPLGPWAQQAGGDIACVNPSGGKGAVHDYGALKSSAEWAPSRGDAMCAALRDDAAAASIGSLGSYEAQWREHSGPIKPIPTGGQGCLYNNSNQVSNTRSQQSFIATIDTPSGPVMMWVGDRWQQSPDGLKGHDPQFAVPLEFNADGSIGKVEWVDEFVIDVV